MTYWRRGTRLGGRSPAFAFFRSHVIVFCFLAFTTSIASFSAYYLGFFSTLLVYLPVALFCIPALAVLDTLDFTNRAHWAQIRKVRFGLAICWCLYILLAPRYPSSGPSSYLNPHTRLPKIPRNQTYFIAANLYNSATVLPSWTRELGLLIDFLGPLNVYVSIYESNSQDQTKPILRAFEMELERRRARNSIVLEDTGGRRPNWSLNGHERIRYMAGVRNKALEPLQRMQGLHQETFDKLIFLNDIYFDWRSIIRLLATRNGAYDLACALDFDGVGLYDIWVTRDSCGQPVKEIWPYFPSDSIAIDNLRRDNPIEVATCWNGVAVFDARWFLPNSQVPTISHASHLTPELPLRFRDNPACVASECFLISYDMHLLTAPERPRIYINPQVSVAYNPLNYLFHTRLTHLSLVRPWRVIWEDWIANRLFGWVSDWFWLKKLDKCSDGVEWDGIVKGVGCANSNRPT